MFTNLCLSNGSVLKHLPSGTDQTGFESFPLKDFTRAGFRNSDAFRQVTSMQQRK